jgi:glycosyltransferase-like protein
MSPRSIGIFTYSTRPRGSVVHACYLAESLAERGHDVTLYALSKAGDELYRELSCPVVLLPAEPAPADPERLIRQRIVEVVSGLRRVRPRHDVYHAEDCLAASGLLEARAELGGGYIVRTLHHLEHFSSAYLQACQTRSILDADGVACVSRVSQRDVERALGRRCPIIGNGVDVARFAQRLPRVEEALRRRWASEPGELVVLSVGGVEPRKNSLIALFGMVEVLRREPRARWLIAGGSSIWEHDAYRRQFAEELARLPEELRSRIVELGPVGEDELTALYRMSQVLLCASLQEGFGLCVLEALASGAAAVVSRCEPFTEYLDDSCASFVEPASPTQIGNAVGELLQQPALRARRADAGLARARRHSWQRVALEHERLYMELERETPIAWRSQSSQEPSYA